MDILFILKALAGLVVILALLIGVFFYSKKSSQTKKKNRDTHQIKKRTDVCRLEDILAVLKDKKSTFEELQKSVECLVKYHATIPHKLGIRAHPDFDIYEEIVLRLSKHPSTNKDLILRVDRVLQKENPSYKVELNNALTKGLNARGM